MAQFTEDGVTAMNNKLDDLNVAGTYRFGVEDSIGGGMSQEAVLTARALVQTLRYYDNTLLPLDDVPTKEEILAAIAPRGHSLTSDSSALEIIEFLATHLQVDTAERLINLNNKSSETSSCVKKAPEVDTSRGLVLFQLDRICKDMQVSGVDLVSLDENEIVAELVRHVQSVKTGHPAEMFEDPPTLIRGLSRDNFSLEQVQLLERINAAFVMDFTVRRRMLLKRLDVTIQSFLWGASVQGKEDEILAVINAQRQHLTEVPSVYTLDDALAAPVSLMHEHTKKITGGHSRGESSSLVKKVIIGHVPDRGGRPLSEDRAKAQLAKDNRWGGGGGGGGGKGGGGRGGGGSKGGGKGGGNGGGNNNSNKGNNKRGGGGGKGNAAKKGKI